MSDTQTDVAREVEEAFKRAFPNAQVVVRQHGWMVRVKVIDPAFKGLGRIDREDRLFAVLHDLRPEAAADITMLLPRAPGDTPLLSDVEFDDPTPLAR